MCKYSIKKGSVYENVTFYHSARVKDLGADISTDYFIIAMYLHSLSNRISNWGNSTYLSFTEDLAKGYMEPEGLYYLIEVSLSPELNYIECTDERYKKGVGEEIPNMNEILDTIGVDKIDMPLMKFLGQRGYAFECFHDDSGEKEMIVPFQLINQLYITKVSIWENRKSEKNHVGDVKLETQYNSSLVGKE
ncbi:MAG: hypothetical protein HUJ97_08530 [Bacteroidales bacterium]|nr:hypothetical protein [Bacteroidales bacterium]